MGYILIYLVSLLAAVVAAAASDQYSRDDFPADFVFGSGTTAYQYEGAAFEGGRSSSIWDTFAHSNMYDGANGDVTCDGYHKYKEDVDLMVDMGLEAFRFSISWSRLIPKGRGPVNPEGLRFYNNFINELIDHGIQPHVILFHIDTPQVLEDEYEGWLSRKIVDDFTAYADVCFREFGDRVRHWTTINEANIFALGGYDQGLTPPTRCSAPQLATCSKGNSTTEPYLVGHNILLAHSATAKLYKEKYKATQKGYIGLNLYHFWMSPFTNSTEDIIASQRAQDYYLGWLLNPLIFGDYPEIMKKDAYPRIPVMSKYESKQIKDSFDFIGLNHYTSVYVKDDLNSRPPDANKRDLIEDMAILISYTPGDKMSGFVPDQYPIRQWGLYGLLDYMKQVYGNPTVYIHENGQRSIRNGTLHDKSRVEYFQAYIGSLLDGIRNGSNVKGYFAWTFLDCLELLDGFKSSFGIHYVDLDDKNLKRYPKDSAHWFKSFLKGKKKNSSQVIEVSNNQSGFQVI